MIQEQNNKEIIKLYNNQLKYMQFQNRCQTSFDKKANIHTNNINSSSNNLPNNQQKLNYRALATCRQQARVYNPQELILSLQNYQPQSEIIDMQELRNKSTVVMKKYRQSIFYGQFMDGKRMGQGIMLYCNGRVYEGEWLDNLKHGQGYEKFQNQSVYNGEYSKGKPEGHGVHSWPNGEIYEGEWLDGVKSGSGIWRGPGGDSYIGQWKNGLANGYGVHTWINGDRFQGQFKDCLKHGQGIEKFSNGDSYKGNYIMGKPQGYGEYYWSNGSFFKGNFENGIRSGKGLWKKGNGNTDKYQGQYKQDKKQGYGVYTWQNGSVYKGNFANDVKQGYGEMYWSDGRVYKGQWINNQQVGKNNHSFNGVQQFKEHKSKQWPNLLEDFQNMKEEINDNKTYRTKVKTFRQQIKLKQEDDQDFVEVMPSSYRGRAFPDAPQSYRINKRRQFSPKKNLGSKSGFDYQKSSRSYAHAHGYDNQESNKFVRKYSVASRCEYNKKMKQPKMDKRMASSSYFAYKLQNKNQGIDESAIRIKPRQVKTSGAMRHKYVSQEIKIFNSNKINPQYL